MPPRRSRLDPGVVEDGAKQAGELAVAVPDQEPRPAPGILEIHDEVLRGLGHPAGSGVRDGAQDPDPPAGVLDDRQHVDTGAAQGDRLEEVAGEQGPGLGAEEVSPGGGGALGCRVDPGLLKDLPDGGGGDLDPEDEQFAVDAAVAPAGILSCQAKHQLADGADGARPARAPGAGSGRVAARQDVPMPAQHCLGSDQQAEPSEHVPREPVQQGGQERPVARAEPRPGLTQLPLQDRDLVAQRQDLHVLVPVAHRK